jgi:large subunit ribosomal protein L10
MVSRSQLKACEKLPTKKQLLATIASLAKQPAKKIAVGVKAVPTKLAIALKKVGGRLHA